MIKQYFTDGLIQIAILLSLLRTDLNSLNNNFMNYPEVQDIILGQTAAYMPTNFHNHYNTLNSLGGSIHPKAINNFHSSIFQGLEALYEFQSFDGVNRDISAFLVSDPQPSMGSSPGPTQPSMPSDLGSSSLVSPSLVSQSVAPHPSSTSPEEAAAPLVAEDNNNNNVADGSSHASDDCAVEAETGSSASQEEELPPPIHLATDPTEEDLDLIDVLYRQDLDLGVGKEAYDTELRIQQEKQCELELQRTRQKERELEAYRLKLEEERKLREQQWREQHFTQDGETGEWMPVSNDPQQLPPTTDCNGGELPIDMEEVWDAAMDLLREQATEGEGETAFNAPQYPSNPPTTSDFSAVFAPNFTQTNTSAGYSMGNDSGYGLPASTTSTAGPALSPSLEESWNDLLQFINSGSVGEAGPAGDTGNPQAMGSPTLLQELASAHSALLQNASMPTPPPETSGLHQLTLNGSGLLPLTPDLNATILPDSGNTSPLAWEQSDLMLGLTDLASHSDLMLPDMLDDVLKEAADLDMEDASNDSAVSLASSSPMQQDLSDVAAGGGVLPYEGLEGATGGSSSSSSYEGGTSPSYSKMSKYDPDEFHSGSSFYSHGQSESSHTNFSSSNDSSHLGPSSSSSSSPFSSSSPSHHVHHNHTYTVPPGQTPREVKAYKEKPKHKGPQSRDEKRARDMNIPLTMSEMIDTPVEEFNEILSRYKLNDAQLQLIRDIRRRGKNKIAAQNCRRRKLDVIVHMEDDLGSLLEMKEKLVAEREALGAQMQEMKEKFSSLYSEIFFSLRDEQGNQYNPEEYTLQTATDGNVFLVPRSVPRRPHPDKDEPVGSRKRKKMDK